jgi:hypothetical protein
MNKDDRGLFIETIAEIKELKGQLVEFKSHVLGRLDRIEANERSKQRDTFSVIAIVVSALSLLINFFTKKLKLRILK